jgi:hypothetical protein
MGESEAAGVILYSPLSASKVRFTNFFQNKILISKLVDSFVG